MGKVPTKDLQVVYLQFVSPHRAILNLIKWSWIHAYRCHLMGGSLPPDNGGNRAILTTGNPVFLNWNFYSKNNFKILTCWLSTLPPPHDPRVYVMAARRIVLPTGSWDSTYDMIGEFATTNPHQAISSLPYGDGGAIYIRFRSPCHSHGCVCAPIFFHLPTELFIIFLSILFQIALERFAVSYTLVLCGFLTVPRCITCFVCLPIVAYIPPLSWQGQQLCVFVRLARHVCLHFPSMLIWFVITAEDRYVI